MTDVRKNLRRVAHENVGRRGAALFGFGVADLLYGISLIAPGGSAQNATIRWFETIAPLPIWLTLWCAVSALCFIAVAVGFIRPRASRYWAFTACIGIKVWWVIMCITGWWAGELSLGSVGVWFGLAYFVALIAGWREPDLVSERAE